MSSTEWVLAWMPYFTGYMTRTSHPTIPVFTTLGQQHIKTVARDVDPA